MEHAKPIIAAALIPAALAVSGAVFAESGPHPGRAPVSADGGVQRIPLTEFERCMMLDCPKEKTK